MSINRHLEPSCCLFLFVNKNDIFRKSVTCSGMVANSVGLSLSHSLSVKYVYKTTCRDELAGANDFVLQMGIKDVEY